jgi:hypothetical protein
VCLAHQNYSDSQVARGRQGAINLDVRRVIASHRIENDLARQRGRMLRLTSHRFALALFDLHYLATFVMAAFRANSVWHAGLTTIRTQGCLGNTQSIVRATFVSTSL